jgi:hypothetical protein
MYGAIHCSTQVLYREPRYDSFQTPVNGGVKGKENKNRVFPTGETLSQVTNCVLMIPPTAFYWNIESAEDNGFMSSTPAANKYEIGRLALDQYSKFHMVCIIFIILSLIIQ